MRTTLEAQGMARRRCEKRQHPRPPASARALALTAPLLVAACSLDYAERCPQARVEPGSLHQCEVPGWLDRAFTLEVPASWDRSSPLPLIVMFHGGGGNRGGADRTTCPRGALDSPGCLAAMALARGYAVVAPDGTGGRPLRDVRTWNAGGGRELQCVSGVACKAGIDDLAYFDDLLAQVEGSIAVDPRRIYATGISNGAAMSHRLACQRPERLAAIAPVAGANEWADDGGACEQGVPVRQFHGTDDPCWPYDGGAQACLQDDGRPKTSVPTSLEGWRLRNGCSASVTEHVAPRRDPSDPTELVIRTWTGCAAATELYTFVGGGHTWPSGWPYFDEERVGAVSRQADNSDLLDFFDAHRRP